MLYRIDHLTEFFYLKCVDEFVQWVCITYLIESNCPPTNMLTMLLVCLLCLIFLLRFFGMAHVELLNACKQGILGGGGRGGGKTGLNQHSVMCVWKVRLIRSGVLAPVARHMMWSAIDVFWFKVMLNNRLLAFGHQRLPFQVESQVGSMWPVS